MKILKLFEEFDVQENIEVHKELNPKLFDGETLKPEVHDKILEIVDEFTDGLKENGVDFKVKDVVIIGSNASYNYTDKSDLDVHLIADTNGLNCPEEVISLLYSSYRSLFDKKMNINFYGINVEIFVEVGDVPTVSNGCYSVLNNNWVKEPVIEDIPEIDEEELNKSVQEWENRYNEIISSASNYTEKDEPLEEDIYYETGRDKIDAQKEIADLIKDEWEAKSGYSKAASELKNMDGDFDSVIDVLNDIADEEEVHVGELQKCINFVGDEEVDSNIEQGKSEATEKMSSEQVLVDESLKDNNECLKSIDSYLEDIYEMRKKGLSDTGEYGVENQTFKEIRNKGYIDNLKELKNSLVSSELSLESLDKFKPSTLSESTDKLTVEFNKFGSNEYSVEMSDKSYIFETEEDANEFIKSATSEKLEESTYYNPSSRFNVGDYVKVISGRKVPRGTIARIDRIDSESYFGAYRDKNGVSHAVTTDDGSWHNETIYLYLNTGERTNEDNCIPATKLEYDAFINSPEGQKIASKISQKVDPYIQGDIGDLVQFMGTASNTGVTYNTDDGKTLYKYQILTNDVPPKKVICWGDVNKFDSYEHRFSGVIADKKREETKIKNCAIIDHKPVGFTGGNFLVPDDTPYEKQVKFKGRAIATGENFSGYDKYEITTDNGETVVGYSKTNLDGVYGNFRGAFDRNYVQNGTKVTKVKRLVKESLSENIDNKDFIKYRELLSRTAGDQVLLDGNGNFSFHNLDERTASYTVEKLRRLDFVEEVHKYPSGKYNFNHMKLGGIPDRYFNISGRIKG